MASREELRERARVISVCAHSRRPGRTSCAGLSGVSHSLLPMRTVFARALSCALVPPRVLGRPLSAAVPARAQSEPSGEREREKEKEFATIRSGPRVESSLQNWIPFWLPATARSLVEFSGGKKKGRSRRWAAKSGHFKVMNKRLDGSVSPVRLIRASQ